MDKRIIIGADDSGFTLKEAVKEYLIKNGYEVTDVGTLSLDEPVVYYEVGRRVAKEVADPAWVSAWWPINFRESSADCAKAYSPRKSAGLSTIATFWPWADLSLGRRWALRWPRLS